MAHPSQGVWGDSHMKRTGLLVENLKRTPRIGGSCLVGVAVNLFHPLIDTYSKQHISCHFFLRSIL